jgi:hypothetical protein
MATTAARSSWAVCFSLLTVVAAATPATAQPSIAASITPSPNRFGWNNTQVTISYACGGVTSCPEPIAVSSEGDRQLFRQTVTDAMGRSATVSTEVSIDFTPAAISFTSPSHNSSTTAAAVSISAQVSDAGSRVGTATCNGDAAVVQAGEVSCIVPLRDGVNDVVVQVTDRAGNSSSTGVQVHRVGSASSVTIVPSVLTLCLSQTHFLQVVDNFGRTVSDVSDLAWAIDDPSVVSIDQGTETLSAVGPGITTVTARWETFTSSMKVRVLPGTSLPDWTTRWTIRELPGYRNNEPAEVIVTQRGIADMPSMFSIEHEIAGSGLMLRAFDDVPHQLWIEAPAISAREHIGAQLTGDDMGAGLLRVETADGRSNSIVRVGRPELGTLWRYTPEARLGIGFADYAGTVDIVETTADGYPALVGIDGMTGSAKFRIPLPRSSVTSLNAACVEGADTRRDRPTEVGAPTVLGGGTVNLALSTTQDVEDALPCGKGAIRRQRTVQQMQVSPDGRVTYRTVYAYPPSGDRIDVVLNRVLPDGHGGQLVAWSARIGRQPVEYTMVRVIDERLITFHLPALGVMVVGEEDLGVTTDGRTIVGFDVTSGEVLWSYLAPANGSFRILHALDGGGLTVATERGIEHIDRAGRRVLMAEHSR